MLKCRKAQIQRNWKHKKAHFVACESKNGNNLRLAIWVALGSTRLRVLQDSRTMSRRRAYQRCIRFDPSEGTARIIEPNIQIQAVVVALGSTRLRVLQACYRCQFSICYSWLH